MEEKERKTKMGKFLQKLGGGALDVVSDIASGKDPVSAILDAVTGGKISPENAKISLAKHQEDLKDIQQSRESNVKIQQSENASQLAKNTPYILIFLLFGLVCGIIIGLFTTEVPPENKSTLYFVLGSAVTAFIGGCTFVHGSSQGSRDKDFPRK